MEDLNVIAMCISAGAMIATSILALIKFSKSINQKKIDLCVDYNKRYEEIRFPKEGRDIDYTKYWNLQFEEWKYCLKGYIDCDVYILWLKKRSLKASKNSIKYKDEFEKAANELCLSSGFREFMYEIFESDGDIKEVKKIFKEYSKKGVEELFD